MLPLSCPQRFKFKPLSTALLFSVFLSTDVYAACIIGGASRYIHAKDGSVCESADTEFSGNNVINANGAGSTINLTAPSVDIATFPPPSVRLIWIENATKPAGDGAKVFLNSANLTVYSDRTSANATVHGIMMEGDTAPDTPNHFYAKGSLTIDQQHNSGASVWLYNQSQLFEVDGSVNIDTYADGIRNYGGTVRIKENVDILSRPTSPYNVISNTGRFSIGGNLDIKTEDIEGFNAQVAIRAGGSGTLNVDGKTTITGNKAGTGTKFAGGGNSTHRCGESTSPS